MKSEEWEEAVRMLSDAFEKTGRSDREVLSRLQKAQRLLKQSKQKVSFHSSILSSYVIVVLIIGRVTHRIITRFWELRETQMLKLSNELSTFSSVPQ